MANDPLPPIPPLLEEFQEEPTNAECYVSSLAVLETQDFLLEIDEVSQQLQGKGSRKRIGGASTCPLMKAHLIFLIASIVVAGILLVHDYGGTQSKTSITVQASGNFLPRYTEETIRNDPLSPQAKAVAWLEEHPHLDHMDIWRKQQLLALSVMVLAACGDMSCVDTQQHECQWWGAFETSCSVEGKYETLMPSFDVYGPWMIPPEVSLLTDISRLVLFHQHIVGPLPSELGLLTTLNTLDLARNQITGKIPSELGSLTALDVVNLFGNRLEGTLPSQLGQLTSMNTLELSDNQLAGPIPSELGSLARLLGLSLERNRLTGSVPIELQNLSHLHTLFLHNNLLSTFPTQLWKITSLTWVNLSSNEFKGEIASEIGQLTNLKTLLLQENGFGGTLPEPVCELLERRVEIVRLEVDCDLFEWTCPLAFQDPCPKK